MWPDRDDTMTNWLNHTLAEAQRLQDNCWSVKVESCGSTVVIWFQGLMVMEHCFPLEWLAYFTLSTASEQLPIHLLRVMAFAWNMYLFKAIFLFKICHIFLSVFPVQYSQYFLLTPCILFFWLSLNLKSKICLNWLQRAPGGFVSMVMRLLIGPEAQAANRPLLVCRGPLLAR